MSVVLKAEKRDSFGTAASRRIKKAGLLPALIYSQDGNNTHLTINAKEFEHQYLKGNILTSVLEIELDNKNLKLIAYKVELDPVSDQPIHVDFYDCSHSKEIKAQPKIVFVDKDRSPGLKKGGFLHTVLRKTSVICNSIDNIPDHLEIDASVLHIGHKVRADAIKLPEGVRLAKKNNFLIASIVGRGKSDENPAAEAAAGTEAPKATAKK